MMTDMERAEHAQKILENPLYREAFDEIEKRIVERWKSSLSSDAEGQRMLKLLHMAVKLYHQELESYVTTGKFKEMEAEEKKAAA